MKVNNQVLDVEVIDTAGQDEFISMLPRYLQSAEGFIFVYAVNDVASPGAVLELYDLAKDQAGKPIKCIVAANKCNLPPDQIQVALTTARDKLKRMNCEIIETSAMANKNIPQLFDIIVQFLQNTDEYEKINETTFFTKFHFLFMFFFSFFLGQCF
jgi:small GTP-binding protein